MPSGHGQKVLAALRGSAINQDGQSSSLTAPNGPSQSSLLTAAMQNGGLQPARLGLLAVHGTGTPLGDPIEVGAIKQALRGSTHRGHLPVLLGSVKSCFSHTEGAAGITGLLMAMHTLTQGDAAPVMHLRGMNVYVEAALGTVRTGSELTAAVPRQYQASRASSAAGTSSFGMSGVNAHAIIDSGDTEAPPVLQPLTRPFYHRRRLWPQPVMHALLHSTSVVLGSCLFECVLQTQSNWHMHDCQVAAEAVLPFPAVLEIMSAAGVSLSDVSLSRLLVCDAVALTPCIPLMALYTCSINSMLGEVHLSSFDQQRIAGRIACVAAEQGRLAANHTFKFISISSSLQVAHSRLKDCHTAEGAVSISSILGQAAPGNWTTHVQAALSLYTAKSCALAYGCRMFPLLSHKSTTKCLMDCTLANMRPPGSFDIMVGPNCLQGVMTRRANVASTPVAGTSSVDPSAWQVSWQPVNLVELKHMPRPYIAFSNQPLSSELLWQHKLETYEVAQHPVVLNCVWACDSKTSSRTPARTLCQLRFAELCMTTDAHLRLVLQVLHPQQRCLYVEQSGDAGNLPAALRTFQAVAESQTDVQLTLITLCSRDPACCTYSSGPHVSLLQGKPTSVCVVGHVTQTRKATKVWLAVTSHQGLLARFSWKNAQDSDLSFHSTKTQWLRNPACSRLS
jgi:hypothetical protein